MNTKTTLPSVHDQYKKVYTELLTLRDILEECAEARMKFEPNSNDTFSTRCAVFIVNNLLNTTFSFTNGNLRGMCIQADNPIEIK